MPPRKIKMTPRRAAAIKGAATRERNRQVAAAMAAGPVETRTAEEVMINANPSYLLPESILQEAERLINGEKRNDYGGALESFTRTAELWAPVLGKDVTPEQVCLAMVGLKMARWVHGQQRDSLVDACGYLALIEHIQRERMNPAIAKNTDNDLDMLDTAWGIIANAYGKEGGWEIADGEWEEAAKRWRDDYHKRLAVRMKPNGR